MSQPTATPDDPRQKGPQAKKRRKLAVEALTIFAISAVLTRVLSDLAGISSLVAEYLFTLVAAVFLLIPYAILTRSGRDFEAHALTWNGWVRGVGTGLALAAATALPFFAGYHLWRTQVEDRAFEFSTDNYRQLGVATEGRPTPLDPARGPKVQLWRDGANVYLFWTGGSGRHRLDIKLLSLDGGLIAIDSGRKYASNPAIRRQGALRAEVTLSDTTVRPQVHWTALRLKDSGGLRVEISLDGEPATADLLVIGPSELPAESLGGGDGGLELDRGIGWIPLIILAQLILVALPEEFFYRGYLQTTLSEVFPQRVKVWIFHLGPAILITSALFALGHFIIDLRPTRLAVFFPSLAFGWLRDRTGTISSCIVYHAACNLMVEAATHHYH